MAKITITPHPLATLNQAAAAAIKLARVTCATEMSQVQDGVTLAFGGVEINVTVRDTKASIADKLSKIVDDAQAG